MSQITVQKVQEDHYTLTSLPCPKCKETVTVDASGSQVWLYNQGSRFTEIFPGMELGTIERFITGLCSPCWDETFWFEEDEEE